ncbi:hypothetical protein DMH17_12760 [Raoultella planticola]|nr:hypothetical protein [Raoultella planticola]
MSEGYFHDQNRRGGRRYSAVHLVGEHEGVYTAADRGFQRFFKAVEPKWDLKTDWQIISEIATGWAIRCTTTTP